MVSYNILSSKLSNESYQDNIDYLEEFWTINEVINFIRKVEEVVTILKVSPKIFKKYKFNSEIHQIEIVKQITLYYQINDKNIELLLFFNNYQDPKNLRKMLL